MSSVVPFGEHPEDENIDLDLLEYLQTLTMAERLKRHEAALELIQKLRAAGEKHHGFDPRAVASAADGEG